jgi:hypothetical protein
VDCIYRVNEYSYGLLTSSYLEREGNRPIFEDSKAHIRYEVTEISSGFSLEYEVLTESGEQVAFRRWNTKVKHKESAESQALESAVMAVYRCASADCLVDGKPAYDILRRLQSECEKILEKEREEESQNEENQ